LRRVAVDVIFVFEPSPILVGIPSALFRQLKKAPQAFWVLDLWPETLKAVGALHSERLLGWVAGLVRLIYGHCDLILAQSQSFVGNIARLAPAGRRIEYFPAWADTIFTGELADPAPEVPVATGVFTVLFAGNIGEAQDFPAILDAAERLKERADIRWVIVGDGRMAGWVHEQIEARGVGKRVLMVGRFPLERMPAFFAHADALLVSLKDEPVFALTIPGKLQSYLAAGIPVLAMLNGEGAAIVEAAGAGLVCPAGDGEGLARIALRLAKMDPAERKRIGDRGRRLCAEEFDRGLLINRLDLWLKELVRVGVAGKG
jgi:glycosyltransferase involved in cell wall biosynthesis